MGSKRYAFLAAVLSAPLLAGACSSKDTNTGNSVDPFAPTNQPAADGGDDTSDPSIFTIDAGKPTALYGELGQQEACAAESVGIETVPLDMYIMFDQSTSMDEKADGDKTRWDVVTSALSEWVGGASAKGTGAGIQYFALGGQANSESCVAADYAKPEVEIAPLGGADGQGDKIRSSLGKHGPSTFTPTGPALQGAIDHATEWQKTKNQNNHRSTIVTLVTDGYPHGCDSDVSGLEVMAKKAAEGDPSIKTFVIGVGAQAGGGSDNLTRVASAGGTAKAALINDSANEGKEVKDSLDRISRVNLSCEYKIPANGLDGKPHGMISKAHVAFRKNDGTNKDIPFDKLGTCTNGGWRFDDLYNPTTVLICPETCQDFYDGSVEFKYGCIDNGNH